jgi:hypothetical protein
LHPFTKPDLRSQSANTTTIHVKAMTHITLVSFFLFSAMSGTLELSLFSKFLAPFPHVFCMLSVSHQLSMEFTYHTGLQLQSSKTSTVLKHAHSLQQPNGSITVYATLFVHSKLLLPLLSECWFVSFPSAL